MTEILTSNLLIDSLEPEDRAAVLALAVAKPLALHETLTPPNEPVRHLHFVTNGVISAVAEMQDGRSVETFMVGFEGLSGASAAIFPAVSFSRHVVQIPGVSLRVDADRFRALAVVRPGLRSVVSHYASALLAELEQSTACNALHRAEQRFAKWLLRCHDRVRGDWLELTQEYLASMLGAQRTTVNEAAQSLQAAGAIRYSRGSIHVLDRSVLEQVACECYARHQALDTVVLTQRKYAT